MSSKKSNNEEPAARRRAYQTYLEDLDDDLHRLLAVRNLRSLIHCTKSLILSKANAPTQAQTEIKARNIHVFAKVLRKQYPELEIEAIDISAHLYTTDIRQNPLEVTFNLVRNFEPLIPRIEPDQNYCASDRRHDGFED
jgi:hypothetical protein